METGEEGFFRDPDIHAWVDLLTNFASLPNVRLEHVRALQEGHVPIDIVNTVMHEMMHHWCFFSPLGEVLALLQYRVRHALLAGLEGKRVDELDIASDLVRYEAAERGLSPIIEGLALFTEHDAVTGGSDTTYCRPLHQFGIFIVQELIAGEKRFMMLGEIDKWLERNRTRPEGVARKADLLASPLHPAKNIYFAGYLTLKAFVIGNNHVFGGSYDKMLGYLRSYFFHDYGLVDALFGPSPHDDDPVIVAERVGQYLQRRLRNLFQRDLASDVKEWDASEGDDERAGDARDDVELAAGITYGLSSRPMRGIDVAPEAAAKGYSWHRKLLAVFGTSNESPLLEGHKLRGVREFANRRLMPICSEPVDVVSAGGQVEARGADGHVLAQMNKIDDFAGEQKGLINFFFIPSRSAMLGVIFVKGIGVAASWRGAGETDLRNTVRLLEPTPSQFDALERAKTLDRQLADRQFAVYGGLIRHVQRQYPRMLNEIYRAPLSAFIAPNVEWREALSRLDDLGIVSVLDTKTQLLDVARLSLIASRPRAPNQLRAEFGAVGRNFDTTLELTGRIRESFGLALIDTTKEGGRIFSVV